MVIHVSVEGEQDERGKAQLDLDPHVNPSSPELIGTLRLNTSTTCPSSSAENKIENRLETTNHLDSQIKTDSVLTATSPMTTPEIHEIPPETPIVTPVPVHVPASFSPVQHPPKSKQTQRSVDSRFTSEADDDITSAEESAEDREHRKSRQLHLSRTSSTHHRSISRVKPDDMTNGKHEMINLFVNGDSIRVSSALVDPAILTVFSPPPGFTGPAVISSSPGSAAVVSPATSLPMISSPHDPRQMREILEKLWKKHTQYEKDAALAVEALRKEVLQLQETVRTYYFSQLENQLLIRENLDSKLPEQAIFSSPWTDLQRFAHHEDHRGNLFTFYVPGVFPPQNMSRKSTEKQSKLSSSVLLREDINCSAGILRFSHRNIWEH